MSLSRQERRNLKEIESGLRSDDPVLVDRLTAAAAEVSAPVGWGSPAPLRPADRWRERLSWLLMFIGAEMTLIGFISARGLISAGTVVGLYGLVILILASVAAARGLARRRQRRKARLSS